MFLICLWFFIDLSLMSLVKNEKSQALVNVYMFLTSKKSSVCFVGILWLTLIFLSVFESCLRFVLKATGVETEKILKGRIWVDIRNIWMVCSDILPLLKSHEKNKETKKKQRGNNEQQTKNMFAHIEVLVTFLLVKIVGLWVIAGYHTMRFWRKLEETFLLASRTFLNQNFRDQTAGKSQKKSKVFEKNKKNRRA